MIKLSRKIEYSLMILQFYKDRPGAINSAREICTTLNIPFDSASKVMQLLASVSILSSIQGVRGGYRLTGNLNYLSYFDLVSLIEGQESIVDCIDGDCSLFAQCNITGPARKLNQLIIEQLKAISVEQLLSSKEAFVEA